MKSKEIQIPFPIQGQHDGQPADDQPLGTTPDCLNVWPYTRNFRAAGGVRSGTTKLLSTDFGAWIQGICQTHLSTPSGISSLRTVLVAGGNVYEGTASAMSAVPSGASAFFAGIPIIMVPTATAVYFIDPNNDAIKSLTWDLVTGAPTLADAFVDVTTSTVFNYTAQKINATDVGVGDTFTVTLSGDVTATVNFIATTTVPADVANGLKAAFATVTGINASVEGDYLILFADGGLAVSYAVSWTNAMGGVDAQVLHLTTEARTGTTTTTTTAIGPPTGSTIATLWRGRLVISGIGTDRQNVYASNIGMTDWDTAQVDSSAAWTLNAATAGRIGDAVSALIPFSDDTLLIGGFNTIWRLDGDPADNGSLSLVSNSLGIWGQNAWCQSPDGTIYFFGSGGIYSFNRSAGLQNISDRHIKRLLPTAPSNFAYLVYDAKHIGIWFFTCTDTPGSAGVTLFYDLRNQGWFPMSFASAVQPGSVIAWVDGAEEEAVLIGGAGGFLYVLDDTIGVDNWDAELSTWTAIDSYAYLGPLQPAGEMNNAKMLQANISPAAAQDGFVAADQAFKLTIQARGGPARDNDSILASASVNVLGTERTIVRPHLTGNSFYLRIKGATQRQTFTETLTTTMDNAVVLFNSGVELPRGIYRLDYISGAAALDAADPPVQWTIKKGTLDADQGVFIVSNDVVITPGTVPTGTTVLNALPIAPSAIYASKSAAEAAYAGQTTGNIPWPGGVMALLGTNNAGSPPTAAQVIFVNACLDASEPGHDPVLAADLAGETDASLAGEWGLTLSQIAYYNSLTPDPTFTLTLIDAAPLYPVWAMDHIAVSVLPAGRVRGTSSEEPVVSLSAVGGALNGGLVVDADPEEQDANLSADSGDINLAESITLSDDLVLQPLPIISAVMGSDITDTDNWTWLRPPESGTFETGNADLAAGEGTITIDPASGEAIYIAGEGIDPRTLLGGSVDDPAYPPTLPVLIPRSGWWSIPDFSSEAMSVDIDYGEIGHGF